ncbi:hypothetical protein SAMN05216389_10671 [Oceanobacillus limi]|uniref:Uncharacterized protein n=1 Tax=Oceanobacillus limi TaxID=930131 RepID=A0A1I0C7Z4_9BACI|nr:hypothetical protein [Oceanobacillus limi]SET15331.1 hypothetical protein SAMN05216389_10671 [Oceanobacillus limi]
MLISKRSRLRPKFAAVVLTLILMISAGAVSAAQSTAYLSGSSNNANTATLTATSGATGNIYVTNSGANTTTRGTAKRSISWWPDSTVASTSWLNPRTSQRVYFSQTSGHKYYGQIVGQTLSARGAVTLTVY